MTDTLSVILRALSFVFLFQAAGMAIFITIFGRQVQRTPGNIHRLGSWCAVVAMVCVTGHYALEAARAAGEMAGVFDFSLQQMVLQSSSGSAFACRMLGLLCIAAALRRDELRAGALTLAMMGAALSLLAFAFTGHTSASPARWWLAPLLIIHLSIVAFWFGALAPLFVVSLHESPAVAGRVIASFSKVATYLVPLIFLAGVALMLGLVPGWSVFEQPYGVLLIAKLVGFTLLMALAALNKWRLGPGIASGDLVAVKRFRAAVATEYGLIVGVLSATAVMTTFFAPE